MSMFSRNSNNDAAGIEDLLDRIGKLEHRLACLELALNLPPESPVEVVEASPLAPAEEATPAMEVAPAADCSEELESLKRQFKACEDELATKKVFLEEAKQRANELKSIWEKTSEQLEECKKKLSDKENEIAALESRYETYMQKCSEAEQQMQDTRAKLSDTQTELSNTQAELSNTQAELSDTQAELSDTQTELSDTQTELGIARQQLEQATQAHLSTRQALEAKQTELQSTQQSLSAAEQKVQSLSVEIATCKVLADRLWPDCLRIPALEDYAAVWREELSNPSADPILLSMFANIFSWACAHEVGERGEGDSSFDQAAIVSLYTFSRFFFEWLFRHKTNPEEADRLSHALSSYINSKLADSNRDYRIETEEVQIDDPYSSKMMMPSPHGASTGVVTCIESWCIMNRSGSVCHKKAQVCLG